MARSAPGPVTPSQTFDIPLSLRPAIPVRGLAEVSLANTQIPISNGSHVFGSNNLRLDDSVPRLAIGFSGLETGSLYVTSALDQTTLNCEAYNASTTTSTAFVFRVARGTQSAPSAVQLDDRLATFGARGYGATGFSSGSRVTIVMRAAENWTDAAQGTYLEFRTTPISSATLATRAYLTANGSMVVGDGSSTLATTAVDGFLYIPRCNGLPTGVPTAQTGTVPMVYDYANDKLYIYNGGWKTTTAFA